jgi:hypothetical protein
MSDDLSKLVQPLDAEPTDEQVASACLSYNHSFGLMIESQRVAMMQQAREWLRAWRKEIPALDPEALARWREEAVQAERQACAETVEGLWAYRTCSEVAAAIRARKGGA